MLRVLRSCRFSHSLAPIPPFAAARWSRLEVSDTMRRRGHPEALLPKAA